MKIELLFATILVFGQLSGSAQAPQASPTQVQQGSVKVKDVVAMKQAGLSDDIVIAKIRQHNTPSDLSTDDLIGLKKEKVSDAVIS